MKSVISADSRHHNRFRRYALRSVPPPVRRVWDLDRIGIGIARTRAMLADPIDDAPSVIPRLNVGRRKGSDLGTGRKPQPRSRASIARSRSPFLESLPERQPVLDANGPSLFRALHATNASRQVSGASSPMSAASTATLRTAVIRAMDTEPSPRASRAPSHALRWPW